MKKLILILTILISGNAFCNKIDTIPAKSNITDVTVFFNGAQITRHAELNVNKGKHLVIMDKLPQEINSQSIQVNGITDCKILSVKHQLNYQNENKKGTEELDAENKIKAQELKIKELKNKLNVFDLEEKLLLDNSLLRKKDEGSAISEIKEAADFYRTRLNEIRQGKLDLLTTLDAAKIEIQKLYSQLNELTAKKHKTYSQILVTLDCEKNTSANLIFSYYISSAGWEPLYDFRVDDITKPLSIVYNANVYQSSGEDWNNVNIKLSTNNPSLSGNIPELNTWYLGNRNPFPIGKIEKGISTLKGRVLDDKTNEGIPFANVEIIKGNKLIGGATTDFDGQYTIKPIQSGIYNIKTTFIGYTPAQINNVSLAPDKITFLDFNMKAMETELCEDVIVDYKIPLINKENTASGATVTVEGISKMPNRSADIIATSVGGVYSGTENIRGARNNETAYFVDERKSKREVETSNYISNTLKTAVANLEYAIEIPYTIPSDGENYSLKIKEVSLPVDYVYHAIPKLDNDAFLIAEIQDWTQLNLLSGKSSIYYQGTFTGESNIDVDQASDTLKISLGRDNNIIVKREGNKRMIDKRIIGNSIKETIGWDITVKNNKNTKIKITVDDQYPLSERKSILIEQLESTNAKIDEKTGKLTWELELEPNEKKVLTYKYSVKYPKYENLMIE